MQTNEMHRSLRDFSDILKHFNPKKGPRLKPLSPTFSSAYILWSRGMAAWPPPNPHLHPHQGQAFGSTETQRMLGDVVEGSKLRAAA